jgi:hypothetical protein
MLADQRVTSRQFHGARPTGAMALFVRWCRRGGPLATRTGLIAPLVDLFARADAKAVLGKENGAVLT